MTQDTVGQDTVRAFAEGETIIRKGDVGDCMFVVLAGQAGVDLPDGSRALFGVGDFFGEMAVIDRHPRSATVTAEQDGTRVLPIDQARFVYLVSHQPAFALVVMSALSRRLRSGAKAAAGRPPVETSYTPVEIRPGLTMLRSRGRASNVMLVAGRNRTVLIDTGLGSAFGALDAALRGIGRRPEDVDLVVLTHEHADHVGGIAALPGGITVAAHPLAANKIELRDDFATVSGVIGEDVGPFHVDFRLSEGSVIDVPPFRFDVMHTPGHTSGCICLLDPRADVVISGDTLMAGGALGGIFGSGNISDYIHSLQRLERAGLRTTLPGHGRASDTGREDAGLALARAKTLLGETRDLFQAMSGEGAFDTILQSLRGLNG